MPTDTTDFTSHEGFRSIVTATGGEIVELPPASASCNTDNTTNHLQHPPSNLDPGIFTGGEDWFEFSAYIHWESCSFESLRARLASAKRAARNASAPRTDILSLVGYPAVVHATGKQFGNGPIYPFRITWQGLTLLIADTPEPRGNTANLVVTVPGRTCLLRGAYRSWQDARSLIHSLGGTISSEILSRADICLDLPGVQMSAFTAAFDAHQYITRARTRGKIESNGTTVSFGKPPLRCIIYDKVAELATKSDNTVQTAMIERRWGGDVPEYATRIEFQVRRPALTRRGVSTIEDYFRLRGDLVADLTKNWLRLTDGPVDRSHTTRAKTLPLWQDVQEGFAQWTGQPSGQTLAPVPRHSIDISASVSRGLGYFLSAAARRGASIASISDLIRFCESEIRDLILTDGDLQVRYIKKLAEYPGDVSGTSTCPGALSTLAITPSQTDV